MTEENSEPCLRGLESFSVQGHQSQLIRYIQVCTQKRQGSLWFRDNLYGATIFSLGLVSRVPGIQEHTCIFYLLIPSFQDTGGRNSELLPDRIVMEKNKVWTKHMWKVLRLSTKHIHSLRGNLLLTLFSLWVVSVSHEIPICFFLTNFPIDSSDLF